MNDVLPKPFTKEGLLAMLDKHLSHLKKQAPGIDPMGAPPAPLAKANRSLKSEDSPAASPATVSNWNSPNNFSGVSPVSNQADDGNMYSSASSAGPSPYSVQQVLPHSGMYHPPPRGGLMGAPSSQPGLPPHRRGISDISGGSAEMGDVKRQHMYGAPPQMQQPMQRPPR